MADPFQYLASLDNFKKNSKWIMQLSGSGPPISLPHYEFFAREAFLRSKGALTTLEAALVPAKRGDVGATLHLLAHRLHGSR